MIQSELYGDIQKSLLNANSITKLKNRFGVANKVIPMLFYGEVGWWKDAPNAPDITDAKPYLDIHTNIQGDVAAMPKKEITYNF